MQGAIWVLEEEQNRMEDLLEGSIVQNMKIMYPKNDLDLSKSRILPEVYFRLLCSSWFRSCFVLWFRSCSVLN